MIKSIHLHVQSPFQVTWGKTLRQDQLLLGRCLLCNLRSCSLHSFSLSNLPKIALVGPCEGLHWLDHEEPKFSKVSMSRSSAIELDEAVLQPAGTNMLLCRLSLEVKSIVSAIDLFSPRICIDLSSFAKLHTDMFEHSIPRPRVTSTSTARVEALVLGRLSSCLTSLATDSVYNEYPFRLRIVSFPSFSSSKRCVAQQLNRYHVLIASVLLSVIKMICPLGLNSGAGAEVEAFQQLTPALSPSVMASMIKKVDAEGFEIF